MVIRHGRYYARLMVPKSLRAIVGKRELTAALGPDRRQALRDQALVMAQMQAELDAARMQLAATTGPRNVAPRGRAMYARQIAAVHYANELTKDDAARRADLPDADLFRDGYRKALAKVAGGHASDQEASAIIGWAIDGFASRGNVNAVPGSDHCEAPGTTRSNQPWRHVRPCDAFRWRWRGPWCANDQLRSGRSTCRLRAAVVALRPTTSLQRRSARALRTV
jgi:hypothetical protein